MGALPTTADEWRWLIRQRLLDRTEELRIMAEVNPSSVGLRQELATMLSLISKLRPLRGQRLHLRHCAKTRRPPA